ncbi:mechanosensitive ion channel domain-containing protein [uncultured Thiocystis sp.]|jgi:potassium efflux system protein|uniref:mechanosensitive ion channel domain-containing protein n=1 Tax=uncultured Thiocystis sp. TaxID=1202134 RepID=UPI0025E31765|nr:mechanosensitive ion channel domain-containing protein [uncultured Thiocystis sp.]
MSFFSLVPGSIAPTSDAPLSPSSRPAPDARGRWRRSGALALLLAGLFMAMAMTAASAPSDGPANLPSPSQLASKIAEAEAATGLDEATKAAKAVLIEQYRRAQANLEDIDNFNARADDFAESLKTAPAKTAAILKELESDPAGAVAHPERLPDNLSALEISQRLNKVLAEATAEETRLGELEKLIEGNADRPTAARGRLSELKQRLDQIDADLRQAPAAGEVPELAQARRWALETQRAALWAEGRMVEQELLSQAVRESLYKAQREQTAQALQRLKARQTLLEELQNKRRTAEAEAAQMASEEARLAAEDKHRLVREETKKNADITDSLGKLARELDGLSGELTRLEAERKRIEDDFRGAKQRLDLSRLSKALGQVLLDRRKQLPDLRQYRKTIEEREDGIAEATLRQLRYREEERRIRDLDRYLGELSANDESARQPDVRRELAETLQQRKSLMTQALTIEDEYIRQLGELNYAAEQVIESASVYDGFLAERLLWVRSTSTVGLKTLASLPAAVAWMLSWEGWQDVARVLAERIRYAFPFWLGLASVALLFWKVAALQRAIRATAEPLRRVRTDGVRYTIKAIGLTLLAALPLPLMIWLLGHQLLSAADTSAFTRAIGAALGEVSFGLYYLRAFRMLCIPGGVADRHFRWNGEMLKRIRRDFDGFTLFVIPIAFVTVALYHHNDPAYTGSLGLLTLVASMLGFAVFFARLLNPGRGVLKRMLEEKPNGWLNRLRHVWFPGIVGAPLALAGLALVGYVYTAGVLFQSLVYQTWLVLALVVLHQSIVRWLIVTRRQLALQAALDRQATRRAQAEAERTEGAPPSEVSPVEEPEPDLAALDEQTRRLINASIFFSAFIGLWLTWSDVLPAFTVFEEFALWHYTGLVDGSEQRIPVTAADAGLVILIVFIATVAARNLPALLEILLLQSTSVSAGGRYAIKTLVSYLITAIAFLLAFSTIGFSWSQVQWLVAALGVGIGFGLQEIVANFISGLIILFERPVRVGDIVTIGDTTGVVTNIQIRATTIRNWDKQELLVPNKEFITERLLNWTLTDQQNRITIPIGIEYGSDTKLALSLLRQVAEQHPKVLDDPAPLVSFEGFGDSGLTVILRCYLDSLDERIGVITELHQAIYESFSQHGLLMAFPQRDVHLSASEPLEIRLQRSTRQSASPTPPVP